MNTPWHQLVSSSREDMREQLQVVSNLLKSNPATHLYHDPVWLLEAEERNLNDSSVYVANNNDQYTGYAPFIVQPWNWRLRIGEITLSSTIMNRLYLHGGPLLANSVNRPGDHISSLLIQLRPKLGNQDVLFFEGVRLDGDLYKALEQDAAISKRYHILPYGKPFARQFIRMPANFDEFMQTLSKRTREGLRRNLRKLNKFTNDNVELKCITKVEDIDDFITKAVSVSEKTYQWNLLGLGLRDVEKLRQTLTSLSRHNWTCCYLLLCQGTPTAFMIGYKFQGTYYYIDVGFDPDWSKWSVGSILHMEVIRDLYENHENITLFDFSPGTGEHKERFSNETHEEVNIILLPRNLLNWTRITLYKLTEAVSYTANHVLERLGIKAKIKKLIRRLSTQ